MIYFVFLVTLEKSGMSIVTSIGCKPKNIKRSGAKTTTVRFIVIVIVITIRNNGL